MISLLSDKTSDYVLDSESELEYELESELYPLLFDFKSTFAFKCFFDFTFKSVLEDYFNFESSFDLEPKLLLNDFFCFVCDTSFTFFLRDSFDKFVDEPIGNGDHGISVFLLSFNIHSSYLT